MAKRKDSDQIVFSQEIVQKTMEDVMHDSMMPYSEHVILERALPRVEDGLKPVQRRILFTMHELGITSDKPHRKCARIVGDCLGKYHPHGDSSVYDALARMAQPFAMRLMLVDGHGNFGSIDGDSPAAMRYTEARMTNYAELMLKDIDKDTVGFHLNFDDTLKEPDLLPAYFPNLLVNGAMGIAVGLATNIPPHNLGESIDAAIALIDKPQITTRELMKYIPGPDFPTGGVLACGDELYQAYETGRGRLKLRAKVHVEDGASGRKLIVLTEMPYPANKAALLEKILRLSEEKKSLFSGIYDIRDESDRTGMRAVIELRKDADADKVLAALYKYSDLQMTFGVNMVAIADGKPMQLGLKAVLDYFIRHQKGVVTRRTRYELSQAEARAHILEGLIVAVDNLDEVIALIRASKTPKEAKQRLMDRFALTDIQAQAILDMRLQRLTNLEILSLRQEFADLQKLIRRLKGILASEKKLLEVIKDELKEVREKYADPRRTELVDSFEEIEIEPDVPQADDAAVLITRAGFVKRMPPKDAEKAADACTGRFVLKTDEKLLFFSDAGNCYPMSAGQIPECKPKERGLPFGGILAGLEKGEHVVSVLPAGQYRGELLFVTRGGMVKRTVKEELDVRKGRFAAMGLKGKDRVLAVLDPAGCPGALLISRGGMAVHFALEDVSVVGRTAGGVKGMTLAPEDEVMFACAHDGEGEIVLASDRGYLKRCLLIDYDRQARGGKGVKTFSFVRNGMNGMCIAAAMTVKEPYDFVVRQKDGTETDLNTELIPIETKPGKGAMFVMVVMDNVVTGMYAKS